MLSKCSAKGIRHCKFDTWLWIIETGGVLPPISTPKVRLNYKKKKKRKNRIVSTLKKNFSRLWSPQVGTKDKTLRRDCDLFISINSILASHSDKTVITEFTFFFLMCYCNYWLMLIFNVCFHLKLGWQWRTHDGFQTWTVGCSRSHFLGSGRIIIHFYGVHNCLHSLFVCNGRLLGVCQAQSARCLYTRNGISGLDLFSCFTQKPLTAVN